MELVAPQVGGVTISDGEWVEAQQRIGGAPSVLYDAVALLITPDSAAVLCENPAAVDFVSDAYAHCKYIAFVEGALPLLRRCSVSAEADGLVELVAAADVKKFVKACSELRVWSREQPR